MQITKKLDNFGLKKKDNFLESKICCKSEAQVSTIRMRRGAIHDKGLDHSGSKFRKPYLSLQGAPNKHFRIAVRTFHQSIDVNGSKIPILEISLWVHYPFSVAHVKGSN